MIELNNIKNIIFDFGGVVINIDHDATIEAFRELGIQNFEEMFTHLQQIDLFKRLEVGMITPAEFRDELRRISGLNASDKEIDTAWNAMLLDFPVENQELLLELRKKFNLFLLSNTNEIHIRYYFNFLKKEHGMDNLNHLFKRIYLSHQIQLRKPNPEVFKHVLEKEALLAGETLFIDDTLQHVEGARKTGIAGYHLRPGETIRDLFKHFVF
ncbi:MAG: HAD family hydrolase [Bacteroidota bacterium]